MKTPVTHYAVTPITLVATRAASALANGNYQEAINLYQQLIDQDADDCNYYINYAKAAIKGKKYLEASSKLMSLKRQLEVSDGENNIFVQPILKEVESLLSEIETVTRDIRVPISMLIDETDMPRMPVFDKTSDRRDKDCVPSAKKTKAQKESYNLENPAFLFENLAKIAPAKLAKVAATEACQTQQSSIEEIKASFGQGKLADAIKLSKRMLEKNNSDYNALKWMAICTLYHKGIKVANLYYQQAKRINQNDSELDEYFQDIVKKPAIFEKESHSSIKNSFYNAVQAVDTLMKSGTYSKSLKALDAVITMERYVDDSVEISQCTMSHYKLVGASKPVEIAPQQPQKSTVKPGLFKSREVQQKAEFVSYVNALQTGDFAKVLTTFAKLSSNRLCHAYASKLGILEGIKKQDYACARGNLELLKQVYGKTDEITAFEDLVNGYQYGLFRNPLIINNEPETHETKPTGDGEDELWY